MRSTCGKSRYLCDHTIILKGNEGKPQQSSQWIWVIDQACSVKMAGYWPSSFFLGGGGGCLWTSTDREGVEVHKLAKKRTRPISSHLDPTSLVNKEFIYGFRGNFCGTLWVVPSGQDSSILTARVANHNARFTLPAHGASRMISWVSLLWAVRG